MLIRVNGGERSVRERITVKELIHDLQRNPETLVVERNSSIVPQSEWDATVLKDNDSVEVLSFVGGG